MPAATPRQSTATESPTDPRWRLATWLGGGIILALLVWQRWELANIAQWREDQTTNLWLGLQTWRGAYLPPIGLINSLGVPNPNGMNWIGFLLSIIPSLRVISFVLGLAQLALIARVCQLLFTGNPLLGAAALLVAGSCLQVVLPGLEFWAQWTLGLVNLLFFSALFSLRQGSSPFLAIFVIVNCALAAPALYLAGVLNSIGYGVILVLTLRHQPNVWRSLIGRAWQKVLWISAVLLHLVLVWLPFAWIGAFSGVGGLSRPIWQRLKEGGLTLVDFPLTLYRLLPDGMESLCQVTPTLMSPRFYQALRWSHALAAGLIVLSCLWLWRTRQFRLGSLLVFPLLLSILSPLLGGFAWGLGERPDQVVQFLPLLLIFAFSLFRGRFKWQWPVFRLAVLFAGTHLQMGHQLETALVNYRGEKLGEADLPLDDRRRAVDFIAGDWLNGEHHSVSDRIPVHYSYGEAPLFHEPEVVMWVGIIRRYGGMMSNWFPDSPYTIGRGYDWELMRRWHLETQDNGTAETERSWKGQRYTLSMVGLPPPAYLPSSAQHHEFGRVRVSIVAEQ